MFRTFVVLGSINALLAVALGAFGAHGLKGRLPADLMAVYQTGVQYHMYHALGLLLVAALCGRLGSKWTVRAGWFLFAGIVLFSGSLYALSLSEVRMLGMITPFGGVAFLLGWASLAISAWKERESR